MLFLSVEAAPRVEASVTGPRIDSDGSSGMPCGWLNYRHRPSFKQVQQFYFPEPANYQLPTPLNQCQHWALIQHVVNMCAAEQLPVRAQPHLSAARIGFGRTIHQFVPSTDSGTPARTFSGNPVLQMVNHHVDECGMYVPHPQSHSLIAAQGAPQTTTSLPLVALIATWQLPAPNDIQGPSPMPPAPPQLPVTMITAGQPTDAFAEQMDIQATSPPNWQYRSAQMSDSDQYVSPEPNYTRSHQRPAPQHFRSDPVVNLLPYDDDEYNLDLSLVRPRTVSDMTHPWYEWVLLPPDENYHTCASSSDNDESAFLPWQPSLTSQTTDETRTAPLSSAPIPSSPLSPLPPPRTDLHFLSSLSLD
jgi:hypothetical protein